MKPLKQTYNFLITLVLLSIQVVHSQINLKEYSVKKLRENSTITENKKYWFSALIQRRVFQRAESAHSFTTHADSARLFSILIQRAESAHLFSALIQHSFFSKCGYLECWISALNQHIQSARSFSALIQRADSALWKIIAEKYI